MKRNLTKIKSLISRIIAYNLTHDTHIFINFSPHVKVVTITKCFTEDKKWVSDCDMESKHIYYDVKSKQFDRELELLTQWIFEVWK